MNGKLPITVLTLCAIAILSFYSFPTRGDITSEFKATPTPIIFTPLSQFSIQTINGTVSFSQIDCYESAILINDTWVFSQLNLDSSQSDLLSDSLTTANLNITTQDSNVTLTSFERLLTPDLNDYQNMGSWLTPGWLNYTVAGVGEQTIKIQFSFANWTLPPQDSINGTFTWPMGVEVYIDGEQAEYSNSGWRYTDEVIPYGTGFIVNRANANVSVKYAWAPIPGVPVNQSPTDSSLQATTTSLEGSWLPYLLIVTMVSGVIVPVALFINRRRLASIINRRIKRKQDPC